MEKLPVSESMPRSRLRRWLNLGTLLVVSVLLLGAIVYWVGVDETVAALGQVGLLAFGGVGLLSAATLAFQAMAWDVLNRPIGHRIRFTTLFGAMIAGMAMNIVTPSSYLGGEPVRVFLVGRKTGLPFRELAGTVVLCKYIEALSFLGFFGVSTIVAALVFRSVLFSGPCLPAGLTLVFLAAALLALGVALWLALSCEWRPLTFLVSRVRRLKPKSRFLGRLERNCTKMEAQVAAVFLGHGREACVAFLIFIAAHLMIFLKPAAFFLLGMRHGLGVGELCLLFAASQALLSLQFTPSGVGTLDGGLIGIGSLVGIVEPQCMAFLLCLRFWDAANVAAGVLIAARAGTRLLAAKEEGRAAAAGEAPAAPPRESPW